MALRLWISLSYIAILIGLFVFGLGLTENLWSDAREHLSALHAWCEVNALFATVAYCVVYLSFTSLSLPGALLLTIFGGWCFGMVNLAYASFASAAGATLACLISRKLLRDPLTPHRMGRWQAFREEFHRHGWIYLLALRLNPLVPYFLINLFFGLTTMPLSQFWLVTQIGMLPLTAIYVWTGTELAEITAMNGLPNTRLLLALACFSAAPLLLRWLGGKLLKAKKQEQGQDPVPVHSWAACTLREVDVKRTA